MSKRNLGEKIKLSSYDDMFGMEEAETTDNSEVKGQIVDLPIVDLHTFENHPFRVIDDESMEEMVESIKEYGVLVPAIVRPRAKGGYEILSGHRRHHACELAGLETMPAIIKPTIIGIIIFFNINLFSFSLVIPLLFPITDLFILLLFPILIITISHFTLIYFIIAANLN